MIPHRGFTLLEIMIALAILGILLALGVPALSGFITNSRLRSVTSELRDGLHTARMEAIRRNTSISMVINGGGWEIKSGSTVLRSRTAKTAELGLAYSYTPTGSSSASTINSSNTQTFIFTGNGRMAVASANGTIDIKQPGSNVCLKDGGDFACLRISATAGGMIRVCNPATSGKADSC